MKTARFMIAICDKEMDYACRLMEYLRNFSGVRYPVSVYSSAENLACMVRPEEIAVLVISSSEYSMEIQRIPFEAVLTLQEDAVNKPAKTYSPVSSETAPGVFERTACYVPDMEYEPAGTIRKGPLRSVLSKYCSMEMISRQILSMCAQLEDCSAAEEAVSGSMCVLGFYTPITRCLQTTFSLTMGELLARRGRTLYLNFENYSGFDRLTGRMNEGNISDLLYYNECAQNKVAPQLAAMVGHLGDLDYVPPVRSFLDMHDVRPEQWLHLIDTIGRVSTYEYLLLDLSESVNGLFELLRRCDHVFMIERNDPVSRAKLQNYESIMRELSYEDVFAKTSRTRFPVFTALPDSLDRMTCGELSDFTRNLLDELFPAEGGKV